MRVPWLALAAAALLLDAAVAEAAPITFYEDLSDDVTYDWAFDLDVSSQNLGSVAIELTFQTFDHNFILEIDGVEGVPLDSGNPAVSTPGPPPPGRSTPTGSRAS